MTSSTRALPGALAAALALAATAGCTDVKDAFVCASDDQCLDGSLQGVCEPDRFCSFPDSACPGPERRYAEHSGERSGACVGRTYHVATTGDDANPGTEAAPFRTLAHGVTVLVAGDTLLVHEGTYAEALAEEIPPGDSWKHPVTIAARPGDEVTVVAPSTDARPLTLEGPEQRYIVVAGVRIDGGQSELEPVRIGADHVRIRECEIVNAKLYAISVRSTLYEKTFVELIGLSVHDNGLGIADSGQLGVAGGILVSSADNLIERCWIHDNDGAGIELYTGEDAGPDPKVSTDRTVIRYNRVHDQGGDAMMLSGGADVLVYDNLVYRSGTGIHVWWESTAVRVFNNTLYGLEAPSAVGIWVASSSTGAVVRNNLVFLPNPQGPELQDEGTDTIAPAEDNLLSHDPGSDPGFVDPENGDFHLRAGSPAIDRGARLPEVPDDFDGVKRPQGSAYDIGAFEAR